MSVLLATFVSVLLPLEFLSFSLSGQSEKLILNLCHGSSGPWLKVSSVLMTKSLQTPPVVIVEIAALVLSLKYDIRYYDVTGNVKVSVDSAVVIAQRFKLPLKFSYSHYWQRGSQVLRGLLRLLVFSTKLRMGKKAPFSAVLLYYSVSCLHQPTAYLGYVLPVI
jgi:hypothetical protein